MNQTIEKINRRKENIETIDPLLSAMRTISLSHWRSSLNRQTHLKTYIHQLQDALHIVEENTRINPSRVNPQKKILYIIGSNRGLCGNFNTHIHQFYIQADLAINKDQEVFLIGKRLSRYFKQANSSFTDMMDFPDIKNIQTFAAGLPFSAQISTVSILYNKYIGASKYISTLQQIYPRENQNLVKKDVRNNEFIIDTDPHQLLRTIESSLFYAQLQLCLLSSLAAESSARFSNMENASRNVDDLINELEIIIQDHRRGKITAETQELSISSGLLNSDK